MIETSTVPPYAALPSAAAVDGNAGVFSFELSVSIQGDSSNPLLIDSS